MDSRIWTECENCDRPKTILLLDQTQVWQQLSHLNKCIEFSGRIASGSVSLSVKTPLESNHTYVSFSWKSSLRYICVFDFFWIAQSSHWLRYKTNIKPYRSLDLLFENITLHHWLTVTLNISQIAAWNVGTTDFEQQPIFSSTHMEMCFVLHLGLKKRFTR